MGGTDGFFDTNLLLHLLSADQDKADRAEALLLAGGLISVQVLNEFVSAARRKLGCDWAEVREVLGLVRALCPVRPLTTEVHEPGLHLAERYGLPVYDAMIAASALEAGCSTLWTEDFQDGQVFEGRLRVCNPFAEARR